MSKAQRHRGVNRAIAQVFPSVVPTAFKSTANTVAVFRITDATRPFVRSVVNLLKNARKRSLKGNVFVTADSHRDHSIEISVRDDGPGIAPDKSNGFRGLLHHKRTRHGLGLAIVKHNAELYGQGAR